MKVLGKIRDKELFKVSSLNSISVLIKIAVGFITSKFLAVFVGPSGMALVGNLRNFISSVESIGLLGFQNGIIKYVAEYEHKEQQLKELLSTVVMAIFLVTVALSGFLYFFSGYLNEAIFGDEFQYQSVFKAFSLSLPWYMASLFLTSVLNGFGAFKKVIKINIYGNLLGLVLSVVLLYNYHTFGALLAVILAPSLLFFIVVFQLNTTVPLRTLLTKKSFNLTILKQLSQYSLMALVSSVVGPLVYLSIRTNVIHNLGYEKAGYWEAMSRISSYYMLFLSTILVVYFLPKLSKASNTEETKAIFWTYFKGIFPVFAIGLAVLFGLKDLLIPVILTKTFLPVSDLFLGQIIGDLLKALSMILGYQFFAKKMTKAFIVSELFSLLILWGTSNYFIAVYGIQGVVIAHALTYFIYLLVLLIYFRKSVF
ncbi:O-antigen translocase [Flavobacterium silvisoli]|uniref:O-antigen translocase n=1 Tax=Flavobacterium silvisoli TaxID=2529433 RepID=A0A4Q9YY05_9FLAO|nr:O-antigen translocase [Flavobacterium silvisoli]TBX68741.1 O-antigen translocase [Flavobacterium silvisoli]